MVIKNTVFKTDTDIASALRRRQQAFVFVLPKGADHPLRYLAQSSNKRGEVRRVGVLVL